MEQEKTFFGQEFVFYNTRDLRSANRFAKKAQSKRQFEELLYFFNLEYSYDLSNLMETNQ